MFENEELVMDEITENEEATSEEMTEQEEIIENPPAEKRYTEKEFNQKLNEGITQAVARREAKLRKEHEKETRDLRNFVDIMKAGTGEDDLGRMGDGFRSFYESKGKIIPKAQENGLTDKEIRLLAESDANELIGYGDKDVEDEYSRLVSVGYENMTPRDKALFERLAQHRIDSRNARELEKIGVGADVYNSPEFKAFSGKFTSQTPITEVYELYEKSTVPKKQVQQMGSMQSTVSDKGDVKDYYSPEEIEKMSEEDLMNPKIWAAVRRSMARK